MSKFNKFFFTRFFILLLSFLLVFEQSGFSQVAQELNISGYLTQLHNSLFQEKFRPIHLRYLFYDNQNNNFKLFLDKGDLKTVARGSSSVDREKQILETETKTLLNYFFVGITLPNESFWVNLRPDSPDKIIDESLAQTDVGKILLEADLQLKKDTAKLTSPENPLGKLYWDKLYKKAEEIFGTSNVDIPTLVRPWIVPDEIIIRETSDNAYIYKATLKVMLEEDFLKSTENRAQRTDYSFKDPRQKILNEYSSQLLRELIIPKLIKETNSSKKYASLRQVYYSLILAQWFKQRFYGKGGLYSWLIDKKDLNGLTSQNSWDKLDFFKAYQKSFKDGEYNLQANIYSSGGQLTRTYFSGGMDLAVVIPQPGQTAGAVTSIVTQRPLSPSKDVVAALAVGGTQENPAEITVQVVQAQIPQTQTPSVPNIPRITDYQRSDFSGEKLEVDSRSLGWLNFRDLRQKELLLFLLSSREFIVKAIADIYAARINPNDKIKVTLVPRFVGEVDVGTFKNFSRIKVEIEDGKGGKKIYLVGLLAGYFDREEVPQKSLLAKVGLGPKVGPFVEETVLAVEVVSGKTLGYFLSPKLGNNWEFGYKKFIGVLWQVLATKILLGDLRPGNIAIEEITQRAVIVDHLGAVPFSGDESMYLGYIGARIVEGFGNFIAAHRDRMANLLVEEIVRQLGETKAREFLERQKNSFQKNAKEGGKEAILFAQSLEEAIDRFFGQVKTEGEVVLAGAQTLPIQTLQEISADRINLHSLVGPKTIAAFQKLNGGRPLHFVTISGAKGETLDDLTKAFGSLSDDEYVVVMLHHFNPERTYHDYYLLIDRTGLMRNYLELLNLDIVSLKSYNLVFNFSIDLTKKEVSLDYASVGRERAVTVESLRGQGIISEIFDNFARVIRQACAGMEIKTEALEKAQKKDGEFQVIPYLMQKYFGPLKEEGKYGADLTGRIPAMDLAVGDFRTGGVVFDEAREARKIDFESMVATEKTKKLIIPLLKSREYITRTLRELYGVEVSSEQTIKVSVESRKEGQANAGAFKTFTRINVQVGKKSYVIGMLAGFFKEGIQEVQEKAYLAKAGFGPAIGPFADMGNNDYVLAVEPIQGKTLFEIMQKEPSSQQIACEKLLDILLQVAKTGILVNDLNLGNVIIEEQAGRLVIIDHMALRAFDKNKESLFIWMLGSLFWAFKESLLDGSARKGLVETIANLFVVKMIEEFGRDDAYKFLKDGELELEEYIRTSQNQDERLLAEGIKKAVDGYVAGYRERITPNLEAAFASLFSQSALAISARASLAKGEDVVLGTMYVDAQGNWKLIPNPKAQTTPEGAVEVRLRSSNLVERNYLVARGGLIPHGVNLFSEREIANAVNGGLLLVIGDERNGFYAVQLEKGIDAQVFKATVLEFGQEATLRRLAKTGLVKFYKLVLQAKGAQRYTLGDITQEDFFEAINGFARLSDSSRTPVASRAPPRAQLDVQKISPLKKALTFLTGLGLGTFLFEKVAYGLSTNTNTNLWQQIINIIQHPVTIVALTVVALGIAGWRIWILRQAGQKVAARDSEERVEPAKDDPEEFTIYALPYPHGKKDPNTVSFVYRAGTRLIVVLSPTEEHKEIRGVLQEGAFRLQIISLEDLPDDSLVKGFVKKGIGFVIVNLDNPNEFKGLRDGERVVIGRQNAHRFSELPTKEGVSREHLSIERKGNSIIITDLNSKNGTRVFYAMSAVPAPDADIVLPILLVDKLDLASLGSIEEVVRKSAEQKTEERGLRDKVFALGEEENLAAHGIDVGKGGLRNLLNIILEGQIRTNIAGDWFLGRLTDGDPTYYAGPHGPYYVVLRGPGFSYNTSIPLQNRDEFLWYLVPSRQERDFARQAISLAAEQGLIDKDIAEKETGKIIDYNDFIAIYKYIQKKRSATLFGITTQVAGVYDPKTQFSKCVDATRLIAAELTKRGVKNQERTINIPYDCTKEVKVSDATTSHTILEAEFDGQVWVIDTQLYQFTLADRNNLRVPEGFVERYVYPAEEYYKIVPAYPSHIPVPHERITGSELSVEQSNVPPDPHFGHSGNAVDNAFIKAREQISKNEFYLALEYVKEALRLLREVDFDELDRSSFPVADAVNQVPNAIWVLRQLNNAGILEENGIRLLELLEEGKNSLELKEALGYRQGADTLSDDQRELLTDAQRIVQAEDWGEAEDAAVSFVSAVFGVGQYHGSEEIDRLYRRAFMGPILRRVAVSPEQAVRELREGRKAAWFVKLPLSFEQLRDILNSPIERQLDILVDDLGNRYLYLLVGMDVGESERILGAVSNVMWPIADTTGHSHRKEIGNPRFSSADHSVYPDTPNFVLVLKGNSIEMAVEQNNQITEDISDQRAILEKLSQLGLIRQEASPAPGLSAGQLPSQDASLTPPDSRTGIRQAVIRKIEGAPNKRITYAEFMEEALYGPSGFYSRHVRIGKDADFHTYAEEKFFGISVAKQLIEMWQALGRPEKFSVVEMGAGTGTLARNIIRYLKTQKEKKGIGLYDALEYIIVERSPLLREQQRVTLGGFVDRESKVRWLGDSALDLSELARNPVKGVFLSNELPDAFSVHRVKIDASGQPQEVYVTFRDGRFQEELGELSSPEISEYLRASFPTGLEPGVEVAVNLQARKWQQEVARALRKGFVLTVDYGDHSEGIVARDKNAIWSGRQKDTQAQGIYASVLDNKPLDITAYVDFDHVAREGQRRGLLALGMILQRDFIWTFYNEKEDGRLTDPQTWRIDHDLGFKVLIQGKGVSGQIIPLEVLRSQADRGESFPEELLSEDQPGPNRDVDLHVKFVAPIALGAIGFWLAGPVGAFVGAVVGIVWDFFGTNIWNYFKNRFVKPKEASGTPGLSAGLSPSQPDASLARATNDGIRTTELGGIDLTQMEIKTEHQSTNIPEHQYSRVPEHQFTNNESRITNNSLSEEWTQIQNMIQSGIIPSAERIKEYLQTCSQKEDFDKEIDKVISCIAEILRLEEEKALPTEKEFREILILLESNKSVSQISNGLKTIVTSIKAPSLSR